MSDDKTNLQNPAPEPTNKPADSEAKTRKVDTEAQEDAAKDREDSGGYQ